MKTKEFIRSSYKYPLTFALLCIWMTGFCYAQSRGQALTRFPVLNQALSDPELEGYELSSMVLEVAPAFTDTVSHRHDAELFGYVLQGRVQIKLKDQSPAIFTEGEMFYEPRNILHTLLRNLDDEQSARILVLFIIKKGRSKFMQEYQ